MAKNQNYTLHNNTSESQIINRERLYNLFKNRPMPDMQLLTNMGLFIRSSSLAQIMYINELYLKIINLPGVIMEFGTWWGQNLILLENMRAIYEPYNYSRKIIGFDTFEGYPELSEKDTHSDTLKHNAYNVSENYSLYLNELIDYHEKENIMGHIKKHSIIKGDARQTIKQYFKDHPETIISLCYFDMALYEPTKVVLEEIYPYLIKGSVLAMDELNNSNYKGETLAVREVLNIKQHKMIRSSILPDRTLIIIEE